MAEEITLESIQKFYEEKKRAFLRELQYLEDQKKSLSKQVDHLTQERSSLLEEVSSKKEEVDSLSEKIDKADEEIRSNAGRVQKALEEKERECNKKIDKADLDSNAARTLKAQADQRIGFAVARVEVLLQNIGAFQSELDALIKKISEELESIVHGYR